MSLSEVYINLLSFEMRFVQRHGTPTDGHAPAANYASRGGRGGCHGGRFVGCSGGAMAAATPTVGITMIVHTARSVAALYDEGYEKDDKHSGCSGGCTVLLS
jgi:hypothetical protein